MVTRGHEAPREARVGGLACGRVLSASCLTTRRRSGISPDQVSAAIKSLDSGAIVSMHSRLDRGGALQARKLANGAVQLYWRCSLGGKTSREPIGVYGPSAPPKKRQSTARGYGLAAALEKRREFADVHVARADTGGLRGAMSERRKTFLAQKTVEAEKSARTLQKLLDANVAYLKTQGRRSHVDADQIFKHHVTEARPGIAEAPAVDLTSDQVLDMLRKLIEAGRGRTSPMRSFIGPATGRLCPLRR